jgi:Tol biopolymer transport system component
MKIRFLPGLLIFVLSFSSCTMEIDQPIPRTEVPQIVSSPTPVVSSEDIEPPNTITSAQIPITWSHLNLTGRLVYTNASLVDNVSISQIQVLDLNTGKVTTIFDAPKDSWVQYITVSPDHTQVLMSYSTPPGESPAGQDLYIMPLDGSQLPQLLFPPPSEEVNDIEAEYSPDGKYIYFTRFKPVTLELGQVYPPYEIYRAALPDGQPELLAEKAFWPRPSADSSYLAYVSIDLFSLWNNKLILDEVNGNRAQQVTLQNPVPPDIIDAPIFSPDGQLILFSAPVRTESYQPNWIDRIMGVRVAKAHSNVASDWWSVPVGGGPITQLTNIQSSGLFASFAPDGKHIVSHSTDGIFVMNPDGSEITMLIPNSQSVPGTVRWIP